MNKIVLATENQNKIYELIDSLNTFGFDAISQSKYNISKAEETGTTFIENAIIKARHASKATNLPAIADDSGLEVDCLKGAPGIYSSRYSGKNSEDKENVLKLLKAMKNIPEHKRTARFHCILLFLRHADDPAPIFCHGIWEGMILKQAQGENGFGYDPIFFIPEENCTSAELKLNKKNQLSHRGQALKKLLLAFTKKYHVKNSKKIS
ncbi:nucleoside 5-triphosphatase [Candidatus Photodesmus katoptron]|uniref:dITP/XTP pyrophosphatase n=1 Tax=Candidatus Photodesmus katoptron Akat1 TaxID=1236703 RepID=S3EGG8_9GAMM|nr:RdgB/HAM1 family non-canonical purine NTP pyrophosphatase [Candidatus Photodesmus katoptron]EPE37258.1 non-canonical purine NTP pyrophosphatase [Candidatus Photodesmus katoptron Akat1]KEY90085.1 nucleoside 5-triphosphatase [Candidatus Photodesmus katoptron]